MTSHPPDGLQRLLDEAPFVQLLARTLLAEEADEVVQQTWLQAVRHGGEGVDEPRSWLARIARNVANNLRRRRDRRRRHENAARASELVPSPAELMAREEHRRLLVAAVNRLPAALRSIVLLRYFEGLPPRRIAAELGVPVATVWNRLRQALQLLRERLDAEHGGQRRAWLLPLVPFAAWPHGLPLALSATSGSTSGPGVIAMTMKTKSVAVIAVLLVATGAWMSWSPRDTLPDLGSPPDRIAEQASAAASELPRDAAVLAAVQVLREPVVVGAGAPSTGELVVNVRHARDKAPSAGVTVIVVRNGSDARVGGWRQPTDAAGVVRFTGLPTGRMHVSCDREREGHRVDVIAGTSVALDYELPAGLEISGIVVDAAATPIPGAIVEVAPLATLGTLAEAIAQTGADGRFTVRTGLDAALVGARADGHVPSNLRFVWDRDGSQAEVRLVLGGSAGSVEGLVVDGDGKPIAGAIVQVGAGSSTGVRMNSPPFPAMARTDAEGRFRAVGVRPGEHPVVGCAAGLGPWSGTCHVVANQASRMRIVLQAGGTVRGTVTDSQGVAVAKAEVRVGDPMHIVYFREFTANDGTFAMTGLPLGEVLVEAKHDEAGKAEQRVITAPRVAVPCRMQLAHGLQLRGRVVDASGQPIEMALVRGQAAGDGPQWGAEARTGADGNFTCNNCPEGRSFRLVVQAAGFETLTRTDIVLGQPIDLVLQPSSEAAVSVRMVGVVLAPDGAAVAGATVTANGNAKPPYARMVQTDASGRFELGPMPPGRWSVSVRTKGYPAYASEAFDLGPDARHDFGVIQLVAGGQARVIVKGDPLDAGFVIYDGASRATSLMTDADGTMMSPMLAPGPHLLRVRGKTSAAQSIPFPVIAGEIAAVPVRITRGVSQAFVLDGRGLVPRPEQIVLDVLRGNEVLVQLPVALPSDRPATVDLCLPDGALTVTVGAAGRELGRAMFRVGATDAEPVRIVMQ